jgi:two-component system phosphate regulon sensor histidine kinase PhoR
MNKIWASEGWVIGATIIITLFFTVLTGYWSGSLIVALLCYIGWIYYRLLKLESWLAQGAKISQAYDDQGFIGHIIRHIYRQKKISSQRKKRTKEILGRLNRNISALPDATVLLNEFHEIEWCNDPAHYLLSIHMRDDIGQRITNLIRQPKFLKYLEAPEEREYLEIDSPDDNNVTLQLKLVRFGDNQSLLTARNVSDQKQLREGLKKFVANASHELKSPLTVISGHLELLEGEPGLSADALKSLQTASRQTRRMRELIEDLLLLSQVESYRLQPNEGERLQVSELIQQVVSALDIGVNKGRITLTAPEVCLLGVKSEIEGICTNLIENALKYSEVDKPISVVWEENSLGEIILTVSDQGPGIAEQDLTHITERYYRGSHTTVDQIQGSGLGLSIVEQAALKHAAVLNIETRKNEGSRFSVVFPSYRRVDKVESTANIIRLADY